MSYLVKKAIHQSLAKAFYSEVRSQSGNYYYFLGKTLSWGDGDLPPNIADTYAEEREIRSNVVYAKKIGANDICFVVTRYDWVENTIYDRFDMEISPTNPAHSGATDIRSAKFYVLTAENNVYKCLDNNKNSPSIIEPTGTDYGVIRTADGYLWKFMYSLPYNIQYRFLTDRYLPVITALSTQYYDNQSISSATVLSGGSGYEGGPITRAEVTGNGTGAKISLNINPDNGSIHSVRITNAGSGYTSGAINIITVNGYGTGAYGNPHAILTPVFNGGKLVHVIIADPGLGYSTDMQTNIIIDGTGKGAKLHPIIENGEIVDVIITEPGYGYSEAIVSIESVTGTGASISVSTSVGDVESVQADVELLANPGAIYVVDAVTTGSGYSNAVCNIQGDGTGLQISPVIVAGKIERFDVISPGTGYSYCKITIVGDGTGATARAILSPRRGHGFNAIDELYSDTLVFYTSLKFRNNQPYLLGNDYRQFGIIKNPEVFGSSAMFRAVDAMATYEISVATVSGIQIDDQMYLNSNNTKKFIVVGIDSTRKIVAVNSMDNHQIATGDVLVRTANPDDKYTVQTSVLPEFDRFSGDLIFVDNRTPIYQSNAQYISLRTTLKF